MVGPLVPAVPGRPAQSPVSWLALELGEELGLDDGLGPNGALGPDDAELTGPLAATDGGAETVDPDRVLAGPADGVGNGPDDGAPLPLIGRSGVAATTASREIPVEAAFDAPKPPNAIETEIAEMAKTSKLVSRVRFSRQAPGSWRRRATPAWGDRRLVARSRPLAFETNWTATPAAWLTAAERPAACSC